MHSKTLLLQFAMEIARQAGDLIVHEREVAGLQHDYKGGKELVTQADLQADELICSAIRARYPDHEILSEESSPDAGRIWERVQYVWIVDPIDGTVNYAHGHNQSAISIACVVGGDVAVAVVFNPFTDEMFHALQGEGAFRNGKPIAVARETELSRAIIATGFPYVKEGLGPMIRRVEAVLTHCADIRRLGSAALDICFLAMGRLDGYYESLSVWDFAAARLIALEAGAECGHFSELPAGADPQFHNKDLLIANPRLYPKLLELLVAANQQQST
ncbi:MAG: inositol monophosphatase family protein [Proteobacteria bacterium]|nr:inositol monophosphatase family protein [Pseudomonadota bacterium]MDA0927788.1 inositol monophosphatase family protein [Pseudomonadota bacterium]